MNKLMMAAMMSLWVCLSRAADPVAFPNADGSGDFSRASAWGGSLPGSGTAVSFATNVYNKTISYKATSDVVFGKMTVMTKKASFDLATSLPKVSVAGLAVYGEVRNNDWQSSDASVNFMGGTWDLGGNMLATCNTASGQDHRGNNRLVQFSSGAVVTNAGYVRVSYQEQRHTLRFTGEGTRLHAANVNGFDYGTTGKSNAFEVVAGAKAVFSGAYKDATGNGAPTTDARVWYRTLVSGSGSGLTVSGELDIGNNYGGCSLEVLDGASVKSSNSIRVGNVQHAPDNRVFVANGATLAGPVYLGGYSDNASSGNSMVVSNATYKGFRVVLGRTSGGSRQSLVFSGADSEVNYTFSETVFPVFAKSPCSEFVLDDGFSWSFAPANIYYCDASSVSSSNTVRILNGAKWSAPSAIFNLGGRTADCIANRLEIGADAKLSSAVFRTQGKGNRLVVSNGTLKVTSEIAKALEIGYVGDSGLAAENTVVLAGMTPKVDVTGGVAVSNGSSLMFAVPEVGFSSESSLIEAASCSFSPDATIAFEGLQALVGKTDLPEKMTLIQSGKAIGISAEQLAAANEQLAAAGLSTFRLKLANGGRDLVLKTVRKGFCILFR